MTNLPNAPTKNQTFFYIFNFFINHFEFVLLSSFISIYTVIIINIIIPIKLGSLIS
jgi:hypothetical protein